MTIIGLVTVCGVITICLLVFLRSHGFLATNYYTTLYFSLANFQEIKPDMTCQEVLRLVGLPLQRSRWQSGAWQWVYSLPLCPDKPYKKFEVVFDNTSRKVTRRIQSVDRLSWDPKTGQWIGLYPPEPASPWEIEHFNYPMIQGDPPIVETNSEKVYLIQIMATWCRPCVRGRARIEKLLKEDLSDVPLQLLLVSVDESQKALREYLNKNQVTAPVAWDPNDHLRRQMNNSLLPTYLLLKGKTLYPFDFPHYSGQSEEYYDDLTWFIRCHVK